MIKRLDTYIFFRLLSITVFVLAVLIFIFIIVDFSEQSDLFLDYGATMGEIWTVYYLNYIPEMIRLVSPVAGFIACLIVTGQMSERLEIVAIKAAGISLYRLLVPFLVFGFLLTVTLSYLDGFVVPQSNEIRIEFEEQYLNKDSGQMDRNKIFRQESPHTLVHINYYDANDSTAYKVNFYHFENDSLASITTALRMEWNNTSERWTLRNLTQRIFTAGGYTEQQFNQKDTTINILPRDLARSSSDVYQLTYPEVINYISSLERSGAGNINQPKVQFFGRLCYPFSSFVVILIGFSIASVRRKGGKGVYIAAGLAISFLYLAFMKLAEPFGSSGVIHPAAAASLPHLFFFVLGVVLLVRAKK